MAWSEKWKPTPFDNQPIPGLLFLVGDLIARTKQPDLPTDWAEWCKGLKYPVVVFPSGTEASVMTIGPEQPVMVNILRQMELPLHDIRDSAYERAQALTERGWRVEKSGDNALDLWLGSANDEYLRITYDNAERLMVNMQIIEAVPTATELLSLKEEIIERFRHLPADHQATLLLALLREVMDGEMGEWILGALLLLYLSPPDPIDELLIIPAVTPQHLEELGIAPEQLATLTDDDLEEIAHRMQENYMDTTFWDKLAVYTRRVLEEKQAPTDQK